MFLVQPNMFRQVDDDDSCSATQTDSASYGLCPVLESSFYIIWIITWIQSKTIKKWFIKMFFKQIQLSKQS